MSELDLLDLTVSAYGRSAKNIIEAFGAVDRAIVANEFSSFRVFCILVVPHSL
jgi:hypothetical protein